METVPYFSSVDDPRIVGHCKHKLSDILMVALTTYLCGGEDYSDTLTRPVLVTDRISTGRIM